jgi:dipeptidyl aminopeptidase/acylaminoacyl peptidase
MFTIPQTLWVRSRLYLAILCSLGLFVSADAADKRVMELEDLFRIKRLSDPRISPDGRRVAYVVTEVDKAENSTNSDIWLVPAEGGAPRKLTNSPKHDRHPRWSPDGKWVAFESNRSGKFQIYLIPADGGEAKELTSLSTGAQQPVWSPDGRRIAFVSAVFPEFSEKPFGESDAANKKKSEEREKSKLKARVITKLLYRHWDSWVDDKRQHLFVIPVTEGAPAGEPKDVTPGDRDAVPTSATFSAGDEFDFSPEGSELAYAATPTPAREEAWSTNHDLYAVNLETGERRQVTANPAADGLPRYSPDGKYIAYRAQARPGFEADRWQLMLYDRAAGRARSLTPDFDSSIEAFVWAPDSTALIFEALEKGQEPVWSISIQGGAVKKVFDKAVNKEVALSASGEWLAFAHQTLSRPVEICKVSLGASTAPRPSEALMPLTHANDELFARITMNEPEPVWFEGAGGAKVQMWIVKPPQFEAGRKYPLVFWVHGGPQGAYLNSWSPRWNAQLWAAQGYVLALPNPRGSTGFGQKFVDDISHDWGGKVFEDLMKGLAYMEKQSYVDTARMAAAGASYGGYMMNWFQGHTDKFKTLVTHCGVYNFWNMYGATEEIWFDEWDHGIPWETPEFDKFSPHRFARNFKTPNLIIHNELDFRVPLTEGLSLFTTLQRKGIPSKLLYFPDEGHWVAKPQNSELWHKTVFDWLADYLKK